ncbi:hypothetical protein [Amycolatopsis sp. cmx-11-51]|uniref:hypothetical protein n=1 Tax=Amycolatopsis sp. cmx-11-51 TaxID=2785797 RepID=UPI0039E3B70F
MAGPHDGWHGCGTGAGYANFGFLEILLALAVATMGGASIMSHDVPRLAGVADRPGVAVGDRADLLLVDGETPTSAVMDRGKDRTVLHDGVVVADGLSVVSL